MSQCSRAISSVTISIDWALVRRECFIARFVDVHSLRMMSLFSEKVGVIPEGQYTP